MDAPATTSDLLQCFLLVGMRDTGRTVGDGAYATVLEYEFRGLTCVGKKIHRLLYEEVSSAQRAEMLQRFEEECTRLSRLRHPSIVQFLGVHVEPNSVLPVLVMEYLPTGNLSGYLDRYSACPDDISYGILHDMALGLRYLHEHTPPIVYRDLSANNVLLTVGLSAKINLSCLSLANIVNLSQTQQLWTQVSGGTSMTSCYVPPEALMPDQRSYNVEVDSYSFGVMILHVLCGKWPYPSNLFEPDPQNPDTLVPATEVDRRARFLQQMGVDHPLSGLVRQCLSNTPRQRPEAALLLQHISTVRAGLLKPEENLAQQLEHVRRENHTLTKENQTLAEKVQTLTEENQTLTEEVQVVKEGNSAISGSNQTATKENQTLRGDNHVLRAEAESLQAVVQMVSCDIQVVRAELTTANDKCKYDKERLWSENCALRECV